MPRRSTIQVQMPNTWLGRLIALAVSAAVLALAFFYFTIVMVTAGVLFLVLVLRALWPGRRMPRKPGEEIIEGEYRIDPEEGRSAPSTKPTPTKR
jgi:membrane protein implicated in regulation of membrane protease activity